MILMGSVGRFALQSASYPLAEANLKLVAALATSWPTGRARDPCVALALIQKLPESASRDSFVLGLVSGLGTGCFPERSWQG